MTEERLLDRVVLETLVTAFGIPLGGDVVIQCTLDQTKAQISDVGLDAPGRGGARLSGPGRTSASSNEAQRAQFGGQGSRGGF